MNERVLRNRDHGKVALPIAAVLLLGLAGPALAQTPAAAGTAEAAPAGEQRQRLADIVALVHAVGYADVLAVELKGRNYEVKARDAAGRSIELLLDAASGDLVAGPSPDEVERMAAAVRAAGHGDILKVEGAAGRYEVLALDSAGREVELKLDATSLEVVAFEREDDEESDESENEDDSDEDSEDGEKSDDD